MIDRGEPTMTATMRAIVLREPGPEKNLELEEIATPTPPVGWIRIAVRAFGLNRSDVHLRLGLASNVALPRVPGIEAVGTVDDANGTDLVEGQQVAALMGGIGRAFDGGYAEYTVVPASRSSRSDRTCRGRSSATMGTGDHGQTMGKPWADHGQTMGMSTSRQFPKQPSKG
jgi:NADPH:quinone reductase-like Zn-dependent oxidoreductase